MANNRRILQRGFGAGEVSPRLLGRAGEQVARNSCRTLTNAFLDRFGSARKRKGLIRVQPVDGNLNPVTFPDNAERVIPFLFGEVEYVLVLYGAGALPNDDARIKLYELQDAVIKDRSDDGVNDYYELDGWTLSDLAKAQYAQNDSRLYLVSENAPPHAFVRIEQDDVFGALRIGQNSAQLPFPGPPVRSWAPPFSLTLNEDKKTLAQSLTREPEAQSITADRPLFRYEDCGNDLLSDGIEPGLYMANYAGQSHWFRAIGYSSPTEVDVVLMSSVRGTLTDGLAFSDWYGPWKPTSVENGTLTLHPSGGAGLAMNVNDIVDCTATGSPLDARVGDIIQTFGESGETFDNVFEVLGVSSSGAALVLRVMTYRANDNYDNGDTLTTANYTIFRPERLISESNVFFTHYQTQGVDPSETAATKFVSDLLGEVAQYGASLATPYPELTYGGGWVRFSGQGADATASNGVPYGYINPPSDDQLWTTVGEARANEVDGYPATVAFHQDRLWMAGFTGRPLTVVASATGRYDDWGVGANDDDALLLELQSDFGDRVQWIKSGGDLLVGTERTEYAISGEPITPSQIGVDAQSAYGASDTQAEFAGAAVLFVGRDGRSLREMTFRFEVDRYQAPDLADLAEHIFARADLRSFNGMKRIAYMQYPDPAVVALRDDGVLAVMSYKRENEIFGWSQWPLPAGATVKDFAVVRVEDFDEVWAIAEHATDADLYGLLRIKEDVGLYSDYGYAIPNGSISGDVASGLPAIYNGREVRISSNNIDYGSGTPIAQALQLPESGMTDVWIGLAYDFEIEPQVPQPADRSGSSEGRPKKYRGARLLAQTVRHLVANSDNGEHTVIDLPASEDAVTEQWIDTNWISATSAEDTVKFSSDRANPIEITAITLDVELDGRD